MGKEFTDKIAGSIVRQKDTLIKNAISHKIGEDWCIDDLTGRATISILPDKTEVFSFDGQALVHFGVMKTEISTEHIGMHMTATQPYRLLY